MGESAFWGFVAASSLILGALITLVFDIPRRVVGLIMGFGAGVLLSAVAYELVLKAYLESTDEEIGLALFSGALVYFAGDWLISRHGAADRKSVDGESAGNPLALVLGALLDGIPESFILGLSVATGGSVGVAYLAAVFLSNLPESIAASAGLLRGGWARSRLIGMWLFIAICSAASAGLGYLYFSGASGQSGSLVLAFSGGAVLAMLAMTMLPEAYEEGGRATGLVTVVGFTLAFFLSTLE
jgi:ZIP family zinc transporter